MSWVFLAYFAGIFGFTVAISLDKIWKIGWDEAGMWDLSPAGCFGLAGGAWAVWAAWAAAALLLLFGGPDAAGVLAPLLEP